MIVSFRVRHLIFDCRSYCGRIDRMQGSNLFYYMARESSGKYECSDWFFLGRDFAIWTVSMETVHAVYFFLVFESRAGKFKLRKENVQILSSSQRNYLKRLIFYRAYNKNEEHKYSRSEFYYSEDIMQRLTRASANGKTIL